VSIRTKLFLTVLALAVPAIVFLGAVSYLGGKAAVEETTLDGLTAVRTGKAHQIAEYIEDIRGLARFFSRDRMVVDAMADFDSAYQALEETELSAEQRASVATYYREEILPRLDALTSKPIELDFYLPTSSADFYLQHHYIVANQNVTADKNLLDDAGDGSEYSAVHRVVHPVLRDFVREFGFRDLYLINGSGQVIYSVSKRADFATSLIDGPYQGSNLALAFEEAQYDYLGDEVQLVDFAPYEPSYGDPASFVAAPIVDGAWLLGVLVFRLPVGEIDRLMTSNRNWEIDGLGDSGETFLVGPDFKMRSNSRFFLEDPEGYLEVAGEAGMTDSDLQKIWSHGTTILIQEVRTEASIAAQNGETATTTGRDYRGIEVLTSYAPLAIEGVDWIILSEIDTSEAYARVRVLTRTVVLRLAGLLALVLVASWFLSQRFVAPIVDLDNAAHRFASGEEDVEVPVTRGDELGGLARSFNRMVSSIRQKTSDLKRTAEELEGVSSVILRWDAEGRIRFMNDFGLELFGFTADELVGQALAGSIVPASEVVERNIRHMIEEIASDPAKYEIDETENQRKDGKRIWMAWRNTPILNEDGGLREILTIGIDITERRRIEREIAAQKQMLENTLESLTHPFYVIDANDYSIKIANSAARALGESGDATCHALTHKSPTPCDSAEHRCPMVEVKKTRKPVILEHVHQDAEGNPRIMEVNGYPIFDDDGNVVQMIEYSIDITERKQAESELRKLSRAVEQSSSSVVITDPAGDIEYVNPKFTAVTGYSLEEALGENPRVLKSGTLPREFYADLWATISSGREWHGEFCNRKKNGELYWESAAISPIRDESGEITHYVAIKDDITDRKRMERELEDARDAAEAANRAKSTFLANMSHELRTPMNAIIGYSEMLAEDAEDEGHNEMVPDLEKINAAGKHLLALINDILDLSKIEAGRMDLFLETFDLRQMLEEAVATVKPLIDKNENSLVTEFAENLGNVRVDLTKLRQALFNLLSNAAKFTDRGTITLAVRKELRDDTEWLRLSVADTGIGITEDKLEAVFEEFSQADDSTTRDYGGTGLGLPISRRFCRMMGGDITVTSELGKGTTFTIELPSRVDALEAAKSVAKPEQPVEREIAPGAQPILVVDDDPASRELLQRTLEAEGFAVVTASTGEEGLELARQIKPSLMTLDVLMPAMDGWSVLQNVKADPELQDIPVMMVSIAGDKDLGYTLGAVESLTKPVDRDRLRALANQYARPAGGGRALVVDDDEGIRSLFQRALAEDGWTVDEAENGAIALELAQQNRPDLVLLDLMMPVMDGFEFVMHYRALEGGSATPIIVVTAKDLEQSERDKLLGGVERIVEKGALTRQQLLKQVRELVVQQGLSARGEE
jgi:PAS domain S-box-containing protein